jgi:hypothetical protein
VTQTPESFRKITGHEVVTAPSGAGALLLHGEEGLDCRVVLGVFRRTDKAHLVAIVPFDCG